MSLGNRRCSTQHAVVVIGYIVDERAAGAKWSGWGDGGPHAGEDSDWWTDDAKVQQVKLEVLNTFWRIQETILASRDKFITKKFYAAIKKDIEAGNDLNYLLVADSGA